MKNYYYFSRLACLTCVLLLGSCAELRILTYPADFTWIGKEHLKTAMHGMANSVSRLNFLLTQASSDTQLQQSQIMEELDHMETYALYLSGETEWTISDKSRPQSNHLLLSDNLDGFIETIEKARLQAQAEPANYYGVGKITGGCASCHRLR